MGCPRCVVWLVVGLLAMPGLTAWGQESNFRAGAAAVKITPPLGGPIVGGFRPIVAREVHDDLHARCLVLDDGQVRLALVVCDLLGIHRTVSDVAREKIADKHGIPKERVLLSATHTHSAVSALAGRFEVEQKLDDYQQLVVDRIVEGVGLAIERLTPAEMAYGTAEAPEHVFNRRWFVNDESLLVNPFGERDWVKMNPPRGPALVKPAGPTDPTISFLAFREPDGRPLAVFAAYSLHYVGGVVSGQISADYFGMFCDELVRLEGAEDLDPPFMPIMANGTSGDVNNIDFPGGRPRREPYEQMRLVAHDVAEKVHRALQEVGYTRDVSLAARYRELLVPMRVPTAEQLAWSERTLAEPEPEGNRVSLPRVYAERVRRMANQPPRSEIPIQVLRIGQVAISSMPCEIFCEIGLAYRKKSPQQPAFMVSLNHGYFGYLPTPEQHELGGYETWMATSRMEVDASERLLEALLEMTDEIRLNANDSEPKE